MTHASQKAEYLLHRTPYNPKLYRRSSFPYKSPSYFAYAEEMKSLHSGHLFPSKDVNLVPTPHMDKKNKSAFSKQTGGLRMCSISTERRSQHVNNF